MRTIVAILVVLWTAVSLAGPTLVVTKSGYYLMTQDANGVPVTEKVTSVVVLGDPGTPVPPSPPPTTALSDKIEALSKTGDVAFKDAGEATAVALIFNVLQKQTASGRLTGNNVKLAIDQTIAVVGGSLGAKERFEKWMAAVAATPGWTYTAAGLADAVTGVTKAFNLDPGILKVVADESIKGFAAGASSQEIAKAVTDQLGGAALGTEQAFSIDMIIQLITMILSLLKSLGILT